LSLIGLEVTHEICQQGEDADWAKLFEPSNFFQKYKWVILCLLDFCSNQTLFTTWII